MGAVTRGQETTTIASRGAQITTTREVLITTSEESSDLATTSTEAIVTSESNPAPSEMTEVTTTLSDDTAITDTTHVTTSEVATVDEQLSTNDGGTSTTFEGSVATGKACCTSETADCLACKEGKTVWDFCGETDHAMVSGCVLDLCVPCIEEGGTWQPDINIPGAQLCTRGCAFKNVSCYKTMKDCGAETATDYPHAAASCCSAKTAECLACSQGQVVATFCANSSNVGILGCPEHGPPCCLARSATCLACQANQSVKEFCSYANNVDVAGCVNGRQECCKSKTARCFACEQKQTIADFCSGPNQDRIPGCEFLAVNTSTTVASAGTAKFCHTPEQPVQVDNVLVVGSGTMPTEEGLFQSGTVVEVACVPGFEGEQHLWRMECRDGGWAASITPTCYPAGTMARDNRRWDKGIRALLGLVVAVAVTVVVATMVKRPRYSHAVGDQDDGLLFAHDDME